MIASQSVESQMHYEEAEERFRGMANGAPTLVACNAADGGCEFVNDTWLKFTGRERENELGDGWQTAIHEGYRDSVLDLYCQALQSRQAFAVDAPLRRRDGVFRWVRGSGTPRFLKDGGFAGFMVCLTDVSDYSETETEEAAVGQSATAREMPPSAPG
jgi:hypothetical protein